MSTGLVKSQNTRLYFTTTAGVSTSDADGVVIHKVYCPTGIQNVGGGQKPTIPSTCLDSVRQEYLGGLPDNEAITVPFNVALRSAAYQALLGLFDSGSADALSSFMVVYPDADGTAGTAPTAIDSNDMLVAPATTSTEACMGYVANLTKEIGLNEIVRGTLTIQTSGAWSRSLPTADLP